MTYDLIIIGGGPAGISAGIYAARQKLNTLLVAEEYGGQVTDKAVDIENYPGFKSISGTGLTQRFKEHLNKFEIETKKERVIRIDKEEGVFTVVTRLKKGKDKLSSKSSSYKAKSVIVASGAEPISLGVPGEKEFIGKGVSYCVTCDGPFFSDEEVAVIGGGNAGFEAALALSEWASKIYILEAQEQVTASFLNKEKVEQEDKIKIFTNAELKEIKGDKLVDKIVYKDKQEDKEKEIEATGVFIEIGQKPTVSFVKNLAEFDDKDRIKVDPYTGETETRGLFAAGDVDNVPYNQIVIACGEGAKAALSATKYVRGRSSE